MTCFEISHASTHPDLNPNPNPNLNPNSSLGAARYDDTMASGTTLY